MTPAFPKPMPREREPKPLRRKTPLRSGGSIERRTPLRVVSERERRDPWAHIRHPAYLDWIRKQGCCGFDIPGHVCWSPNPKEHPVDASHTGDKPAAYVKADDYTAISKCRRLHIQWGALSGPFKGWTQARLKRWARSHVRRLRAKYLAEKAAA